MKNTLYVLFECVFAVMFTIFHWTLRYYMVLYLGCGWNMTKIKSLVTRCGIRRLSRTLLRRDCESRVYWECVKITTLNFDWCVVKLNCWFTIFRWQIEFKTITQNSIVLYNPGGGRGSDFLAVEILEGVIRVKMARGQIVHTVRVNDGQWHKMHLLFNPSLIEVNYLWWKKKFFTYRR